MPPAIAAVAPLPTTVPVAVAPEPTWNSTPRIAVKPLTATPEPIS